MKRLLTLLAATFALASFTAIPAHAEAAVRDPAIEYALAAVPGGTQTAYDEVTWPDGTTLTIVTGNVSARAAVGSCPSGNFCAYASAAGTGSRLTFTTCPSSNSIAALPQVRSIANARTSGTVTGRNGSKIIATAKPGKLVAVSKKIDKVACE